LTQARRDVVTGKSKLACARKQTWGSWKAREDTEAPPKGGTGLNMNGVKA